MKFTETEIEFLKENYPKYGGKYCQPYLGNRSVYAINATANRYGLSAKNKVVHPDLQSVSINKFSNIVDKEVAYFLGYFWSDGHIYSYKQGTINHWRIALEIQAEDAKSIMNIMFNIGKWAVVKRKRKENWKETYSFVTNNKDLYLFLEEHGYRDKSIIEPTKILSKIPDDLIDYFWKGIIDGDGSLGYSGKGTYLELSNSYDYQYIEYNKWLSKVNLVGNIHRQINKKNQKSSVCKTYGEKIGRLQEIFPEYGLERKNNNLKLIIEKYAN